MRLKLFPFLIFLFSFFSLFSQNDEEIQSSLANQYFYSGEFKKSIDIYESLIKKRFKQEYYDNLLQSYYQIEENKSAEKLIKQIIKQYPNNYMFGVDLGMHYIKVGDKPKAGKQFDKVLESLKANQNEIVGLANYFSNKGLSDYAVKAYKRGRELFNDNYRFVYELTFIYSQKGDYEGMAYEYINLLDKDPTMLNQIKIYLGNQITQDIEGKILNYFRSAILKKIQKQPDNQTASGLYMWILMQQKDYESAFTQAKSIDKRFENNLGSTVFELANICMNNQVYDIANNAFKFIVAKGKENPFYSESKLGILSSLYYPFVNTINHTDKEIHFLNKEYESTIQEIGKSKTTIPIMQQYANLLAMYLHKSQEAVDLLDEILEIPQVTRQQKAETKLMRADIYLMENDIWEASLTYSQVEKEFKNDVIGSEAKFKNAMLSFYTGDFEWAASQFDVLRASTTKLIANDAMEYSLLISDNIDDDSTYNALSYFSKAEFAIYQHKYDLAERYLDTINIRYLSHPIFDEVLYKRAEISINKKEYIKADSLLQKLLFLYPTDITADDACYLLAELNQTHFNNKEKAKEYYEKIILDYPSSLYVTESRKRLNILR